MEAKHKARQRSTKTNTKEKQALWACTVRIGFHERLFVNIQVNLARDRGLTCYSVRYLRELDSFLLCHAVTARPRKILKRPVQNFVACSRVHWPICSSTLVKYPSYLVRRVRPRLYVWVIFSIDSALEKLDHTVTLVDIISPSTMSLRDRHYWQCAINCKSSFLHNTYFLFQCINRWLTLASSTA